jgi:hypothetical protein
VSHEERTALCILLVAFVVSCAAIPFVFATPSLPVPEKVLIDKSRLQYLEWMEQHTRQSANCMRMWT